jgi:type IV pilus assembly protein PilX
MKNRRPVRLPDAHARRSAKRQRGVTLVVVMLVLVVVMILGIGGAQIALLGERSTRYDRDYLVATQAAEAALLDAEFDIRGPGGSRSALFAPDNTGIFVADCGSGSATPSSSNQGLCAPPSDAAKPVWATLDFLDTSSAAKSVVFGAFTGRVFQSGPAGIQPELAPRYIIEVVDDPAVGGNAGASASPRPKMYRITAIGFGPRKEVQVVLQTAFRKEKG